VERPASSQNTLNAQQVVDGNRKKTPVKTAQRLRGKNPGAPQLRTKGKKKEQSRDREKTKKKKKRERFRKQAFSSNPKNQKPGGGGKNIFTRAGRKKKKVEWRPEDQPGGSTKIGKERGTKPGQTFKKEAGLTNEKGTEYHHQDASRNAKHLATGARQIGLVDVRPIKTDRGGKYKNSGTGRKTNWERKSCHKNESMCNALTTGFPWPGKTKGKGKTQ